MFLSQHYSKFLTQFCSRFLTKKDWESTDGSNPMDTSLSICHQFDVKIPCGKFVEITSVLKGESTWKLWHRFDVEILMGIRLSKSTKYGFLHVDFSTFWLRIDVTAVLAVFIVLFPNIFCSGNLLYTILV